MPSTTDISLCDVLTQNQRLLQIQNPPTRFNPQNPYLQGYKQFQLNMRRKAEILKYDPSRQSSQTNSLTKSQRWGQIASGKYQTQSFSKITGADGITKINGIPVDSKAQYIPLKCKDNKIGISTPSTACNVPGPTIQLYNDGITPIYMLATKVDNYATQTSSSPTVYYVNSYNNVTTTFVNTTQTSTFTNNTTPVNFASIYIVNPSQDTMTFTMSIPISLYIGGSLKYNYPYAYTGSIIDISISIQNVYLDALYGSNIHVISPDPYFQYDTTPVTFDILKINSGQNTFYASSSIGQLQISNIVLPTISGYIFDFRLSFNIVVTINYPDNYYITFDTISAGIICNITQDISFNALPKTIQSIGPPFTIY